MHFSCFSRPCSVLNVLFCLSLVNLLMKLLSFKIIFHKLVLTTHMCETSIGEMLYIQKYLCFGKVVISVCMWGVELNICL
mgnify:CR=1 FL=1